MTKDIQNNNVTVQINAKDLSGKPLRVHDCDVFVIHFFTDDPKRYLTFSKRDFIVTEFFDEITVPRHQMERLNSGVLQYTIDYLPYNHNCVYEEKGDDCENEFHLHHRHHLHENLIHTRPIVSDIYWRNIHHPHPNFPLNTVTLFDIERLQREIDAERISREKDIQDLQGQFGEGFSDKLDAEIERSKNEDARINATLEALGASLGELGGSVGDNQDKNQTDINQNKVDIASEIARATAKETELKQAIDGEISRAKAQEEVISTSLQMEKERATANEQNINDRLVSLTDRFETNKELVGESLKSEIERAKATESALNDKIQGVVKDLATEVSRAAEKDIEHTNLVTTESNRAQAVENKISTDLETEVQRAKDVEKHILDEVHGVQDVVSNLATATNVYTKIEVDKKISDVNNSISTLQNKVDNHETTSTELSTKVSGLVADMDKAKADILTEVAKCDSENTKLATDLKTLSDSVYTKAETDGFVNDLNSSIASLENWKNNHSDNTEGLNEKVTKLIADTEKLNTDLSTEITNRINADTTLTTKVEVAEGKVDAEVERAKAQEKLISDELTELKENATSKHSELSDSIAETNANLTLEIAERKAQDKVLNDALEIVNGDVETSGSIKKSLADAKAYTDAEIGKAKLANDVSLAHILVDYATNTEVDRKISEIVGTAPKALDTLGKISSALSQDNDAISAINGVLEGKANSSDVYSKNEIDSKVTAIENTISTETTKLSNADSVIDSKVEDLKTKVASIESSVNDNNSTLADAISAEADRAKAQEKLISDKVVSEVAKVTEKVNELNAKVIDDIANSSAKDTELEASISATNTLLSNVETKVDNEIVRSTEKDAELIAKDVELEAKIQANTDNLNSEIARSKQVEKELNDKIISIEIPTIDFTPVNSSIASLDTKIDNAVSTLQTNLDNEAITARANEKTNADNISLLHTSVSGLNDSVSSINADITQFKADSNAKDSELENSINVEKNRAENAENALSAKIDVINGDKETVGSIAHAVEDAKHHIDDKLSDYQPKGDYLTEHQSLENYYTKSQVDKAIEAIEAIDVTEQLKDYAKVKDTSLITDGEGNRIPKLIIDLNDNSEEGIPVYNKNEVDALLKDKVSKEELQDSINSTLEDKVYNKTQIDDMFANIIKTYTEEEFEGLSDEEKNNGIVIVL